jgi:exodeoxyribonuclease VII large subunit
MIPLVSAVRHETDVKLIDFASDKRAPTPTAAAEMAVPVRFELMVRVDSLARRSLACWQRCQEARRTELRAATRALPSPEDLFALPRQRLDHAAARLPRASGECADPPRRLSRIAGRLTPQTLRTRIVNERQRAATLRRSAHRPRVHVERRRERYDALGLRLQAARVAYVTARRNQITRARDRIAGLSERARTAVATLLQNRHARVERAERLLSAVSYRGVLARGFALVRDLEGNPLRAAADVSAGQHVDIEFSDGNVRAVAEGKALPAEAQPATPVQPVKLRPERQRRRRSRQARSARDLTAVRILPHQLFRHALAALMGGGIGADMRIGGAVEASRTG